MTLTAANVRVGVTGALYRAPLGTALPTTALSTPAGSYIDLGYCSDDGVKQSIGRDTSDIKAWQNGDVVRTVQTSHTLTYDLTFLETNEQTLETYYGNYDDEGGGAALIKIVSAQPDHHVFMFQLIDGIYRMRIVIPDGQVTDTGDVEWKNSDAAQYPVTITCFPDSSGVKAYKYLATEDSGS